MKRLYDLKDGDRFIYGGIEWVKLTCPGTKGAISISAEPLFRRAFDEQGGNYWIASSLRRELNGSFLEAMLAEGARLGDFESMSSNLEAEDGTKEYGTAEDEIALISNGLYRAFRNIIPECRKQWWTLTPYTTRKKMNANKVCYVGLDGVLHKREAEDDSIGVRPVCTINAETLVDTPEEARERKRTQAVEEGAAAVMDTLGEYGAALWGDIIVEVVKAIFAIKTDAEDIAQELADSRKIALEPGTSIDLTKAPEGAL